LSLLAGRRPVAAVLSALACACGGRDTPASPTSPLPTASPGQVPGAVRLHASTGIGSYEECLTPFGRHVFFRARSAEAGSELWRTDGTPAGTSLAVDIEPGAGSSTPSCGSVVGGRMLFTADQAGSGREYWLSDGTPHGSVLLDLWPGPRSSAQPYQDNRQYQVAAPSWAVFAADDGLNGREPWATDGTREGTFLLKDIRPGAPGSMPFQFRAVGERVFFSADDGEHGRELWTSDGTPDGTQLVADIIPGGEDSSPELRTGALGLLFFTARYKLPGHATPPWLFFRSDGTRNGTIRLGDWSAFGGTEFQGLYHFEPGVTNGGLFATNGLPEGLVVVRAPLRLQAAPVVARGRLFFGAYDAAHGYELWSSDGTDAGTRLLYDTWPGRESSYAYWLTALDGGLAFEGSDGIHGAEPWLSDGTAAGTRMAADVTPGPDSTWPKAFTEWGGRVYFLTARGELWVLTGSR
jgi:ELWxxDGT repeat protein